MTSLIIFDIDGVLTDGTVLIDETGHEFKKVNMQDVDGLFAIEKSGIKIAAITGEDTPIVEWFEKKFPWSYFYKGVKDKFSIVDTITAKENISPDDIAYVGDGHHDIDAMRVCGLSLCPSNAIDEVKKISDIVLGKAGGGGCIWEIYGILNEYS